MIDTSPLTEVHTSFGFLGFSLVSFSVPRAHWGHHLTLRYHVSLGSSELWWFLRFSMFFMTFDSFEDWPGTFADWTSAGICLLFFSVPLLFIFNKQNLLRVLVPSQAGPGPLPAGVFN